MLKYILSIAFCFGMIASVYAAPKQQINVATPDDLDRLWQAYFTHRDQAYIKQFLEIINQDEQVMFFAYETLNRLWIADLTAKLQKKHVQPNLEDLQKKIQELDKVHPGFSNHVILVTTAMWSLDSNIKKNAHVKEDFDALIKAYPNLNYGQKIQKILGYTSTTINP